MHNLINRLFLTGVHNDMTLITRRAIVFSNYLSALLLATNLLLFLLIPQNHNLGGSIESAIALVIFLVPFLLNRFKLYPLSRLYLCWVPPVLVSFYIISGLQDMPVIPTSYYDGLRYYLIASSVLPCLLISPRDWGWFTIGIAPSFLGLVFCDVILEWFDVGYVQRGVRDFGYTHVTVRSFAAYSFVSGSLIMLRYLVERSDERNTELLSELEVKNELIRQQAKDELRKVNEMLIENLKDLQHREFILNHSQRVAKVGSWEYWLKDSRIFWSDEMYNIFGLDNSIDLRTINLTDLFSGNDGDLFMQATVQLLKTGSPYDVTVRSRTPFGYIKWLRIYSFPIVEDGNVLGARGICHDITYYKEAEELLREREGKYQSLFEQAFDPIVVTDHVGGILDVNASFIDLMGYSRSELLQRNVQTLIEQNEPKNFPIRFDELRNNQQVFSERKIVCKDGTLREVEISAKRFGENQLMAIIRDVTEIRKVRKAIEESEERFRTAFEYSAIGMALLDTQGKFTKVNEELCSITGYNMKELMQMTFREITHPDDVDVDQELFQTTLMGERSTYNREKRYYHKQGHVVWVNISVSLVRDTFGEPVHFVTQIENISDRKRTEAELVETEAKFRTLVEQSLVGVYILVDDRYNYVNPALARIVGYDPEEIVAMGSIEQLVYPEDMPIIREQIVKRLSKEILSSNYEFRVIRKSGEVIWVEVYGSRISYNGKPAIIGTVINITDRKLLEKEQALLASIVSSSNDAIISASVDGKILTWNPGANRIFGYSAPEVIGKHIGEVIPVKLFSDHDSFKALILSGGSIEQSQDELLHPDGTQIEISKTISPLRSENGIIVGSTVIARDVTYQAKAERAVRESEERYRILVDNAPEAMVLYNLRVGKFQNVSASAVELFKYSKEQLLDMGPADVSPEFQPDGRTSMEAAMHYIGESIQKGKVSFEWTHLDAEGRLIPCEVRLIPLPSDDGYLLRGSILDISDRLERDRELAEANKQIGELKLMALRSVMSPHFIFNVLNSIQFFIAKNDRLNAINYLSTFSKLIRSVLTHSVNNRIRLSDELELLKNYIELEMTRFENKFRYNISLDSELDVDAIAIPSLLIQPYVENAILHGLYNKTEGEGVLNITVRERSDVLYFVIEDNGIGREAARKLRDQNFPKHKSMGIKLTEERLKLINESRNVSFEVVDLVNNDVPSGTRVIIGVQLS